MGGRLSIKRLLIVLLGVLAILVAALAFVTTRQLDTAAQRADVRAAPLSVDRARQQPAQELRRPVEHGAPARLHR